MRKKILAVSACLLLSLGVLFFTRTPQVIPPAANNIAVYGDSQSDSVHRKIVADILKLKPVVVFHTGDLTNDGNNPAFWKIFNSITGELRSKSEFYPALGNHENESPLYFANFTLPNNEHWYSLERQGIHFIILDTGSPLHAGSEQFRWLEDDLKAVSKDVRFKLVFFHKPLFSVSKHGPDELGLKADLLPLFEKYGVSAVFSGHEHGYQRFLYQGIYFIVSGGAGGSLYNKERDSPYLVKYVKAYNFSVLTVKPDGIDVVVYNIKLKPIDKFEIKR